MNFFLSKTYKEFLEKKINDIKKEVESLDDTILIDSDFEQLKNYFYSKYLIKHISISENITNIENKKGTDGYDCDVVCQKHYDGDSSLFELIPRDYLKPKRSFSTYIKPQDDNLLVTLHYSKEETEKNTFNSEFIEKQCNQELSEFYENIKYVNNDVDLLNGLLDEEIEKMLKYYKKNALSHAEIN